VQTAFIKAPSAKINQRFSNHLALDGDTLAVSAIEEEPVSGTTSTDPLFQSGDVYVFERSAGIWSLVASLKSTDRAEKYYFGHALALRGDTLLVGAFGEGRTLPASGALYIFKRKEAGWLLEERRVAPNAGANDRFGAAVALTSELIAVSAVLEASDSAGLNGDWTNDRTPGAGAVFLYAK
jgi:hypothetical protein